MDVAPASHGPESLCIDPVRGGEAEGLCHSMQHREWQAPGHGCNISDDTFSLPVMEVIGICILCYARSINKKRPESSFVSL